MVTLDAADIQPQVTWGTSPQMVTTVDGKVPDPAKETDPVQARVAWSARSSTWGCKPNTPITEIRLDKVFIGSCTNSRIEDLRAAAAVAQGQARSRPASSWRMVVPGSGLVKAQAEQEGLDKIFIEAGFEWREPGCSMCLGMNEDQLSPGERCASTSNRNFEGRQGAGGRTHLVSPAMAAAAAIAGHFVDVREFQLMKEITMKRLCGSGACCAGGRFGRLQYHARLRSGHGKGRRGDPEKVRQVTWKNFIRAKGWWRRSTAPTSIPTRSSPSSS